jgi:hypothetical protein
VLLLNKNQGVKEEKMSNKSILKFGVAFVVLAVVLIFLGVNYVPRIFASSLHQRNTVVDINQSYILHSHYHNFQYQRAIVPQLSYVRSVRPIGTERFFTPPPISNYIRRPVGTERFFTPPPMSNYISRPVGTERFFTPPPADYTP